jgi:WXG100 family type VII secretion target
MTITLDHQSFAARTLTIGSRADAMSQRRREIERDVDRLLASWRGAAADRFAEAWLAWRDGADGVIAGLAARAESLAATRDDLAATDARIADSGARLRGRLG